MCDFITFCQSDIDYNAIPFFFLRPPSPLRFLLRYALILEDDMQIAFSRIDWESLIASAPDPNFTILQLITSNGNPNFHACPSLSPTLSYVRFTKSLFSPLSSFPYCFEALLVEKYFTKYKAKTHLWIKRDNLDLWCAGAYIVNKEMIRGYLDAILTTTNDKRLLVKVAKENIVTLTLTLLVFTPFTCMVNVCIPYAHIGGCCIW